MPELRADEAEDLREACSDERELLAEPVAVASAAERELKRELTSALWEARAEETDDKPDEALPVRELMAPAPAEVPALAMDEAPETATLPTDEAPETATEPTEEAPEIPWPTPEVAAETTEPAPLVPAEMMEPPTEVMSERIWAEAEAARAAQTNEYFILIVVMCVD